MSNYALITGAANGIGRSIAEELAKRNFSLLLADIDGKKLQRTASSLYDAYRIGISLLEIDLSDEDAPQRLWQWSEPFHQSLSVIINNAGYGINGAFETTPLEQHLNLIRLNIGTVVGISHLFTPVLRQQPKAWLLNVASTTAYQTVPYLNSYSSSKAFVLSFTRGLRKELSDTTISVSCLSPGSTDTNFVGRAGMSEKTRKLAKKYNMSPEQTARAAVEGLFKGKAEIIPGLSNKAHVFFIRFFPKTFIENIAAKIYGPGKEDNAAAVVRFKSYKKKKGAEPLLN